MQTAALISNLRVQRKKERRRFLMELPMATKCREKLFP